MTEKPHFLFNMYVAGVIHDFGTVWFHYHNGVHRAMHWDAHNLMQKNEAVHLLNAAACWVQIMWTQQDVH